MSEDSQRVILVKVNLRLLAEALRLPEGAVIEAVHPGDAHRPDLVYFRVRHPGFRAMRYGDILEERDLVMFHDASRSQFR